MMASTWGSARAALLVGLVAIVGCAPAVEVGAGAGELRAGRIETPDGRVRAYHVYLPRGYADGKPWPTVLVFHGGGGDAAFAVSGSFTPEAADAAGVIAVYPQGFGPGLAAKHRAGSIDASTRRVRPRRRYNACAAHSPHAATRYTLGRSMRNVMGAL